MLDDHGHMWTMRLLAFAAAADEVCMGAWADVRWLFGSLALWLFGSLALWLFGSLALWLFGFS
jgi:hypothetical protein